ncbi:MAG: 4-amino-4-deoxychorismate lyase, partial [Halothece sp.]
MFWYDGTLSEKENLEFALNDPGLIYGATVFTTLRVYGNDLDHPLTNWQAHCDRLSSSLETFDWVSPNWERLRLGAEVLKVSYPILRITLFPDGREW